MNNPIPLTPLSAMSGTFNEAELIRRAIGTARPHPGRLPTPRWQLVQEMFATNFTVAQDLCTIYGFDPNEHILPVLTRPTCDCPDDGHTPPTGVAETLGLDEEHW